MFEPYTYQWICPHCGYKVIFEQYETPLDLKDIDEVGKVVHLENTFDTYVKGHYIVEVLNNRSCVKFKFIF